MGKYYLEYSIRPRGKKNYQTRAETGDKKSLCSYARRLKKAENVKDVYVVSPNGRTVPLTTKKKSSTRPSDNLGLMPRIKPFKW